MASRSTTKQSPLDWSEEVLSGGEDVLMLIRSLWMDLQMAGLGGGLSLDVFTALLESDERFECFDGVGFAEYGLEGEALLEHLGLESGPRVKLADRGLTADYVGHLLQQSAQQMLEALEGAWETRPGDDLQAELQLLEIMTMAQKLKHEVDTALADLDS